MVLVISRFKVANGLEKDVAEAFRKRPRLVENVPGFLGMEVFTPHSEPSIFHLVTRWTDRETYHAWHKSPDHHLSHELLPKGLKLDPRVTQILELERLPQLGQPSELQEFLGDSLLLLESFLTQTDTVVYCVVSPDGHIQVHNQTLLDKLKTTQSTLQGQTIWNYLTDPDQQRLRQMFEFGIDGHRNRTYLNFTDVFAHPFTLDCLIQKNSSHALILIGEEPQQPNQTAFEEIMQIQNEMVVKMRAELKTGRQLTANNAYLDHLVSQRTDELVEHQKRLREMLVELTLVEQRERQKLAADLHDYQAQLLIACKLKLAQLDRTTLPSGSSNLLQHVNDIIEQSLTFTRTLIADLHPVVLQHHGLLTGLQYLSNEMKKFGLAVSRPDSVPPVAVSEEIGILVYKTVRELLMNVLKHSKVKQATIHWETPSPDNLLIRVMDSGIGFDPTTSQLHQKPGHLGLFFYQERIKAVRGHLEITSSPQQGTCITLHIPLAP